MTARLFSPALADRGARFAGVGFTDRLVPRPASAFTAVLASQAAAPAAPSGSSLDGAAFSHFTESCPVALVDGQDSAPAATPPAGALIHTGNAILLPDHMMVAVRAIAAYERCSNERAVTLALVEYCRTIGAGPLARAVADHLCDELADVPDFERSTENRFRGGP